MNKKDFLSLFNSIYFKNVLWLVFEKALRVLYAYFIFAAIARYLGPDVFGEFNYILSIFSIFFGLSGLGYSSFFPKDIIDNKNNIGSIIFNAFIIKLAINILIILFIFYLNSILINKNSIYYLLPLLFIYCFNVFEFFFIAEKKIKIISISKILQLTFGAIIFTLLISHNLGLNSFFVGYFFIEAIYILFIGIFFYFDPIKIKFNFLADYLTILIKKIWPLVIFSFLILAHNRTDQIMIYYLLDSKSVGIYSAAIRISEALYFIPVILSTAFIAPLAQSFNIDSKLFESRLSDLIKLTFVVSIICIIFLVFCGDFLILSFFGFEYFDSIKILIIHSIVCIPVFIAVINNNWFIFKNAYKSLMYISLISILINIILNFYWLQIFGLQGAAYATLVSKIFLVFFGNLFFAETRENFKFSTLFIVKLFSLNFFRNKS